MENHTPVTTRLTDISIHSYLMLNLSFCLSMVAPTFKLRVLDSLTRDNARLHLIIEQLLLHVMAVSVRRKPCLLTRTLSIPLHSLKARSDTDMVAVLDGIPCTLMLSSGETNTLQTKSKYTTMRNHNSKAQILPNLQQISNPS
jgi:hypothetical protein